PIGNRLSYLIEPEITGSKLSPKGELGKLIGYNDELRSYRILSDNGLIIDTKSVQFLDHPQNSGNPADDEILTVLDDDSRLNTSPASDPVDVDDYETAIEESSDTDESDSSDSKSDSTTEDESEVANTLVPEPRILRDRTSK
ncbi:hypothetical protein PSTG_19027, partial [Puccinia striiformis f. sp. tritici PST-78]